MHIVIDLCGGPGILVDSGQSESIKKDDNVKEPPRDDSKIIRKQVININGEVVDVIS